MSSVLARHPTRVRDGGQAPNEPDQATHHLPIHHALSQSPSYPSTQQVSQLPINHVLSQSPSTHPPRTTATHPQRTTATHPQRTTANHPPRTAATHPPRAKSANSYHPDKPETSQVYTKPPD